mgnify:FL=1
MLVGPLDLLPAVADEAVRPMVVKVAWNPGVFRQFLLLLALTGPPYPVFYSSHSYWRGLLNSIVLSLFFFFGSAVASSSHCRTCFSVGTGYMNAIRERRLTPLVVGTQVLIQAWTL